MAYIDNKETKKLYWTINEVAKMVGVNATTLRYWEDKFPRLRPKDRVSLGNTPRQTSSISKRYIVS